MKLDQLKREYLKKELTKADYIRKMFDIHKYLYDYSEYIKNTDIEKIEITDGNVVMTTREDIKFLCDSIDQRIVPIEILNFNSYEKSERNMALSLIENGYNIFDIGANYGWYSLLFSKYFKNAKIFAFEPIKKTFYQLQLNIQLNQASNVLPFNLGFSDENVEKVFYFNSTESGSASMANIKKDRKIQKTLCKVFRLDDFIKTKKITMDFIKCDVEGSELLVFKGGLDTIIKYKPIIFTEMLRKWSAKFDYHPNEIIYLLKNIGYKCYTIKNNTLKQISKIQENTQETNFFFLHSKKHAAKIKYFSTTN